MAYLTAVNLAHILITGPLIVFVAVSHLLRRPISPIWYGALLALAVVAILYHLYLLFSVDRGAYGRYINVLHLLIGALLLFVTASYFLSQHVNVFWYTLMLVLGVGAIGYHLFMLLTR